MRELGAKMPDILYDKEISQLLADETSLVATYQLSTADFKSSETDELAFVRILKFIDKYVVENPGKTDVLCFSLLNKFALQVGPKLVQAILKLAPEIINAFNLAGKTLLMQMCVDPDIVICTAERLLIVEILIQHGADSKILSQGPNSETAVDKLIGIVHSRARVLGDDDDDGDEKDPAIKMAYNFLLTYVPMFVLLVKKHTAGELAEIFAIMADLGGDFEGYYDKIFNQFYNVIGERELARLAMLTFSFNPAKTLSVTTDPSRPVFANNKKFLTDDASGDIRRKIFSYLF